MKKHEYGFSSVAPKDSDVEMKARPIVSYVLHTGKQAFSRAGRAGMFIIEQTDTILVTRMREVTTQFRSFNSMCSEKEYIDVLKSDIKYFFCNLPHALIFSALEFFKILRKIVWDAAGLCAYRMPS